MELTTQMLAETDAIRTRVHDISKEMSNLRLIHELEDRRFHAFMAELNPYKVRLENILCETDVKEQAHSQCEF